MSRSSHAPDEYPSDQGRERGNDAEDAAFQEKAAADAAAREKARQAAAALDDEKQATKRQNAQRCATECIVKSIQQLVAAGVPAAQAATMAMQIFEKTCC